MVRGVEEMFLQNQINLSNMPAAIYLWGTGKIAHDIMEQFEEEVSSMNICGFIDNDKKKEGNTFYGYKVFQPNVLEKAGNYHVIVLNNFFDEIAGQISNEYKNVVKCEGYRYFIKFRLIARYQRSTDKEILEILKYIQDGSLSVFNYPFSEKYHKAEYVIRYDGQKQLFYAIVNQKKMYFSRQYQDQKKVENYLRQIMMEQDMQSPHCYLAQSFQVKENAVVLDAGVAEGNFTLSIIDKVKKVYLVEPDKNWVEALRYTFEPYMDKVVIVNKYLSDYESKETATVDGLVTDRLDFIKMDIEGEEYYALQGSKETISKSETIKCVACTYHQEFDYINLERFFDEMGMVSQPSGGYMWFPYDKDYFVSLPTLRRGLIRAEKRLYEK